MPQEQVFQPPPGLEHIVSTAPSPTALPAPVAADNANDDFNIASTSNKCDAH